MYSTIGKKMIYNLEVKVGVQVKFLCNLILPKSTRARMIIKKNYA